MSSAAAWTDAGLLDSAAKRLGAAVGLSILALALRWLIDPLIGDALFYVTAFPAVAVAVWCGGPLAGVTCIALCLIWAEFFFIPPRMSLAMIEVRQFVGAFAFVASSLVIVALGSVAQRARARSRQAERELGAITDSVPVLISYIDSNLVYRLNNKAYEEWFELKRSNITGRKVEDVLGAEAFGKVRDRMNQALQGQEVSFRDYLPYTRRGGRWVSATYRPRRNAQGEIEGLVALVVDVTDQHLAEASLAEREREFRGLFELNATGAAQTQLPGGRFTRVNGKFREMLGCSEEELLGMSFSDVVHPEDRQVETAKFQAALEKRSTQWESELRFVRKDGAEVWALVRGTILRDGMGHPTRTIASIIDLTGWKQVHFALEESEARLRFALDAAGFGAWEWIIGENRVIWSDRLYELHGVSREQFDGSLEGFQRLVHPEDLSKVGQALEASLKEGAPYDLEFRAVRPGGEVFWIWTTATIFRKDGRPARMIGTAADVTDRKRSEELLRSQAHHLEELVRDRTARLREVVTELESFAYTIAHDLRAPLRSMHGFASVLEEDYGSKLGGEARECLRRITSSAERMDALINDVLEYSMVTRQELRLQPIDPEPILRAIIEGNPALQSPNAVLELRGSFPRVLASNALLTQSFSNLLGNAVKFVEPGKTPRVEVFAEVHAGHARIFVQDNGIGINPNYHEQVFGLFNRLNREYSGTGIGLAIVKRAVERMNGQVGLESVPNQGSCFWIELRLAES